MGYRTNRLIEFPKDLKSSKQRLRYLTVEEEKRLLKELNPMRKIETGVSLTDQNIRQQLQDNYDLVVLLLDTGCRLNEISHLEWKYVDLNDRKLHIWRRKNKVETVLDMTQRVFDILSRRDKSTKWIFTNKLGDGPRNYCRTSFKKACERAGFSDVSWHTLRHTFASRLLQNGMTLFEVKELLGHSDIQSTMVYSHLEQKQTSRKAVRVLDKLTD
jgi:integrase